MIMIIRIERSLFHKSTHLFNAVYLYAAFDANHATGKIVKVKSWVCPFTPPFCTDDGNDVIFLLLAYTHHTQYTLVCTIHAAFLFTIIIIIITIVIVIVNNINAIVLQHQQQTN